MIACISCSSCSYDHIAGARGNGSTAAFLFNIIREAREQHSVALFFFFFFFALASALIEERKRGHLFFSVKTIEICGFVACVFSIVNWSAL